jgi:hypothetical protein
VVVHVVDAGLFSSVEIAARQAGIFINLISNLRDRTVQQVGYHEHSIVTLSSTMQEVRQAKEHIHVQTRQAIVLPQQSI